MKAAVASFQFTGSRHDFHHSVRSASTLNSSCLEANGSMQSRSGGASSSRLIHAHPPHSSHRTGARREIVGAEVGFVELPRDRSTKVFLPSRPQHHPWNGQTKVAA